MHVCHKVILYYFCCVKCMLSYYLFLISIYVYVCDYFAVLSFYHQDYFIPLGDIFLFLKTKIPKTCVTIWTNLVRNMLYYLRRLLTKVKKILGWPWISNYAHIKLRDTNTYQCPNLDARSRTSPKHTRECNHTHIPYYQIHFDTKRGPGFKSMWSGL